MESFEQEGKSIGLILDVSVRHNSDGLRIIDVLKEKLVKIIQELVENDLDGFYLYRPQSFDLFTSHGEQVASVCNYDNKGWQFSLSFALKQTMFVLKDEHYTNRKYLILITDRLSDLSSIKKYIQINKKDNVEAKFVIIGIGDKYNADLIRQLSNDVVYIHLNDPNELDCELFKGDFI